MYIFLIITVVFFLLSLVPLFFRMGILMSYPLRLILIQATLVVSLIAAGFMFHRIGYWYVTPFLVVGYICLGWYMVRRSFTLMVKDTLDMEWSMFMSEHERTTVDPSDFPDLDHEYYNSQSCFLEENGFDKLGDFDYPHISRVYPQIRSFTRLFLSKEHDIFVGVQQNLAKAMGVSVDQRVVTFGTDFTDGTSFATNNAKGIREEQFEEIIIDYHPSDTAIAELLKKHRESIGRICIERGVDVQLLMTDSDVHAAGVKRFVLLRQNLLIKGGGNVDTFRRKIDESTDPNDGKVKFYKEYLKQAHMRAEKERRKHEKTRP